MSEAVMQGSIEQVPIDSLIQIIAPGKKTGVLQLKNKNRVSKIYFDQGDIVFVSSNAYDKTNFLKNYLTHIKRMNSNNIKEIDTFGNKYGYTFEQSLFTGKYLEKDEINYIIKTYFEDLLCEIFTMKNGEYEFSAMNSVLRVGTIKLESNFLLMEAGRRIDVKEAIYDMFKNRKLVFSILDKKILFKKMFAKNVSTSDTTNDNINPTNMNDISPEPISFTSVGSNEQDLEQITKKNILNQINGIDNIDEIIMFSGWSEFRTLEFLKELYIDSDIECIGEKESSVKLETNVVYSTSEKVSFFSYALALLLFSFFIFMLNVFNINTPFLNIISIEYSKINYNELVISSIENFYTEKVDYANKIFYINNMKRATSKDELLDKNYINRKEYDNSKDEK